MKAISKTNKPRRPAALAGAPTPALSKALTGIMGLDEITGGGLPRGRPTLLCGMAGSGKTLLAMEFLVRGATSFGEPGVFMTFEETTGDLATNFASLGHDLNALVAAGKLAIDFVRIERAEIEEAGDYDLEGLLIRLGLAIEAVGARRVVLDTLEALFSGLSNTAVLRAELRRLFRWLKDRGITAVITAERGENGLSRHGLEEYVADCVILLDHRIEGQMATRRLRIAKYRGSTHGTSEYPFLIDEGGISLLPVTSIGLNHQAGMERISSGIPRLDAMMGGKGFYRGSSVLVSGTAGTGKTSVAAHFVDAATRRGERALWLAFEESASQIVRNMRSIGIDLVPAVSAGTLRFQARRASASGLEMHLLALHRQVLEFEPAVVVVDPLSSFAPLGDGAEVKTMLMRLIDFLKMQQVTALFTNLVSGGTDDEATQIGVSSLMDSWLLLREIQSGADRNRVMHLLKSRGMAHSNQVREFVLTDRGAQLVDVYTGPSGALLAGSGRVAQEALEKAKALQLVQSAQRRERDLERNRMALEAQIAALRAGFEAERAELQTAIAEDRQHIQALLANQAAVARARGAEAKPAAPPAARRHGGRA